jgi:hypothetical protein
VRAIAVSTVPAVLGCRVAEADVIAHEVGGQGDVAVSGVVGHGQRPVTADARHRPGVAVANRFTSIGEQAAVVAAGGDHLTDVHGLTTRDGRRHVHVVAVPAGVTGSNPGSNAPQNRPTLFNTIRH